MTNRKFYNNKKLSKRNERQFYRAIKHGFIIILIVVVVVVIVFMRMTAFAFVNANNENKERKECKVLVYTAAHICNRVKLCKINGMRHALALNLIKATEQKKREKEQIAIWPYCLL